MQRVKIGVDVGGTFTDVVAVSEKGEVYFEKLPSTPSDQSVGVVEGIRKMLQKLLLSPDCVTAVAHGTTVATNTLLERTGGGHCSDHDRRVSRCSSDRKAEQESAL